MNQGRLMYVGYHVDGRRDSFEGWCKRANLDPMDGWIDDRNIFRLGDHPQFSVAVAAQIPENLVTFAKSKFKAKISGE